MNLIVYVRPCKHDKATLWQIIMSFSELIMRHNVKLLYYAVLYVLSFLVEYTIYHVVFVI